MEFKDIAIEALASLKPLLIPLAFVAVATIIAVAVLVPAITKKDVEFSSLGWAGLFYKLGGYGSFRLSLSWVKLLLLLIYLIMFEELSAQEYVLFLFPALLFALDPMYLKAIPGRIFWLVMEVIGLFTSQIVCTYIHDMRPGRIFTLIYIAMAMFLALLGIYVFLCEVAEISEERRAHVKAKQAEEKNGRISGQEG